MLKYENFAYTDKQMIQQLLESSDQEQRVRAVVGMVNGIDDQPRLQSKLLELVHDKDFWVAKMP